MWSNCLNNLKEGKESAPLMITTTLQPKISLQSQGNYVSKTMKTFFLLFPLFEKIQVELISNEERQRKAMMY